MEMKSETMEVYSQKMAAVRLEQSMTCLYEVVEASLNLILELLVKTEHLLILTKKTA